jgi:hypothetical protein
MAVMERRQIWQKRAFLGEKSWLLPTQVSALSHFFDPFFGFSASFAVVTLTPFLPALRAFGFEARPASDLNLS